MSKDKVLCKGQKPSVTTRDLILSCQAVHIKAKTHLLIKDDIAPLAMSIPELDNAIFTKAIEGMTLCDGRYIDKGPRIDHDQEQLLDLINYATILYLKLEGEKDNGPDERKS